MTRLITHTTTTLYLLQKIVHSKTDCQIKRKMNHLIKGRTLEMSENTTCDVLEILRPAATPL